MVFLEYHSRSGSTLLAQKLNQHNDMVISLESGWLNFRNHRISMKIEDEVALDGMLNELYTDSKFVLWKLDRESLRNVLIENLPFDFKYLLNICLDLFDGEHSNSKVKVFKGGNYYLNYDRTKEFFPDGMFIFVLRDPRAIYNSQLKSKRSFVNKVFQDDVVKFVIDFKLRTKIIESFRDRKEAFFCVYEELLENEDKVLIDIFNFLGLKLEYQSANKNDYYKLIPDTQKHLHKNLLANRNITERAEAWKNELPIDQLVFIQNKLKREIRLGGYSKTKVSYSLKILLKMMVFEFKYYLMFNMIRKSLWRRGNI